MFLERKNMKFFALTPEQARKLRDSLEKFLVQDPDEDCLTVVSVDYKQELTED